MRQKTTGVSTGVNRNPSVKGSREPIETAGIQRANVAGVDRILLLAGSGIHLKIIELDHGRDECDLLLGHQLSGRFVHPCAVLDAVDSGSDELADSLLTEYVCRHSAAMFMRAVDRRLCHLNRPERCEVSDITIDPVPHKLHPAVPAGGLVLDLRDELVGFHFLPVVPEVSLGARNVPP